MPSLNFKGKVLVQNFHLLVPYHELKPVKAKSLADKASLHDKLVVHGDKQTDMNHGGTEKSFSCFSSCLRASVVFAPTKYLDSIHLEENRVDFCQLPFEIYKAAKPKKP